MRIETGKAAAHSVSVDSETVNQNLIPFASRRLLKRIRPVRSNPFRFRKMQLAKSPNGPIAELIPPANVHFFRTMRRPTIQLKTCKSLIPQEPADAMQNGTVLTPSTSRIGLRNETVPFQTTYPIIMAFRPKPVPESPGPRSVSGDIV